MADPAACIDVGSQLRGIGRTATKLGTVIGAPQTCAIWPPPLVSQIGAPGASVSRPRASRDPHGIIGGRMVAESEWAPAIVDDRDVQNIIGKTSRMDDRADVVLRR